MRERAMIAVMFGAVVALLMAATGCGRSARALSDALDGIDWPVAAAPGADKPAEPAPVEEPVADNPAPPTHEDGPESGVDGSGEVDEPEDPHAGPYAQIFSDGRAVVVGLAEHRGCSCKAVTGGKAYIREATGGTMSTNPHKPGRPTWAYEPGQVTLNSRIVISCGGVKTHVTRVELF